MHKFIELNNSLVVPDLDPVILTSCSDQAQIVPVGSTDNILLVAFWFATFDKVRSFLVMHHLVHVNLYDAVLAACDNSVVITTIPDEADLSISWVVLLKLQCHDT